MKYDVITIGAAVRDVYVQSDEFVVEDSDRVKGVEEACFILGKKIEVDRPIFGSGGGATNAAATFAHLGLKTSCIAQIGDDDSGKAVQEDLHKHGVHTKHLLVSQGEGTGYSILLTTKEGQRTAVVYRGAAIELDAKQIDWKNVNAKWLYVTNLSGDMPLMKKILKFAASHDIKVAWNPGSKDLDHGLSKLTPMLKQIDFFTLNREECAKLTGLAPSDLRSMIKQVSELVTGAFALTDGPRGTYACYDHHCFHALPSNVPVTNATGAGDAFGSAFVAGLIEFEEDIVASLRLGTLNAEAVIQEVGAKKGLLPRMPGTRKLSEIKVEPFKIN